MEISAEEESLLDRQVGDLLSRRRFAERLIHEKGVRPVDAPVTMDGSTLYYGMMKVRLLESGDPTVVRAYDADGELWGEIDTAGEDPERIEELQRELDHAYLHRNDEL